MFMGSRSLVALPQLQLIWVIPFFLEAAAALTARFYNKELRPNRIGQLCVGASCFYRPNIALSARRAGVKPAPTIALCYYYSHWLAHSYL